MRKTHTKFFKLVLLSIFSFVLGCTITLNMIPFNRTCKLDDTDVEYNVMKNSKLKNPELIILILSAPANLEKRNTIRETWLKLYSPLNVDDFKVKHYFAIGSLGLNFDDTIHLSSEQSKYGDILILPLHDSYENLTIKLLASFEWLTEQIDYGLGFEYVLKCDDDTFVRLDYLVKEIVNIKSIISSKESALAYFKLTSQFLTVNIQANNIEEYTSFNIYWGYFKGNAQIKTSGKWKETEWIFCDRYVPYAQGGGYILSRSLVTYLGRNKKYLRKFNSEDVTMGLWLSSLDNIVRIHDVRFDTEWKSRGCQSHHIMSHKLSNEVMRNMYQNLLHTGNPCKEDMKLMPHYFYNWSVPPSKCCERIK